MLTPLFSSTLASNRKSFNKRFAAAKRDFPLLSQDDFFSFLTETADPIVRSISTVHPERASSVTSAIYDIGLQLVCQALAGPGSRITGVGEGLKAISASCPGIIAEDPGRALGCIANAAVKLAAASPWILSEWCKKLGQVARECRSLDDFKKTGGIAAWLCGMSCYRASALESLSVLPESLIRSLLVLGSSDDCGKEIHKLKEDPWYRPGAADNSSVKDRATEPIRVGSFRGFGGTFITPPLVAAEGERIVVSSEDNTWMLFADAFGAMLSGATKPEPNHLPIGSTELNALIGAEACRIEIRDRVYRIDAAGKITSAALTKHTLAYTTDRNHSIFIVPLT